MSSSSPPPWTALHIAAEKGNLTDINRALAAGADINALGQCAEYRASVAPLWIASDKGHVEAVKLLLSKGADPETRKSDSGSTALIVAAYSNLIAVVDALLDGGANIDNKRTDYGQTALIMAMERGHAALALHLLQRGADPNIAKRDGTAPLQLALDPPLNADRFPPVLTELLARGANPCYRRARDGASLLWILCEKAQRLEASALAILPKIPRSELSVVCGSNGSTPLHEACAFGSAALVKALVTAGAEVGAERRADRATPLWIACERGEEARPIINALVAAGATA